MSSYRLPRRGGRWVRSSRLVNPLGSSLKAHRAESRAWTRSSVKRRPGTRVPAGVVTGAVIAVIAAAPAAGSWLIFWTPSRRRLAVKPTCRSAGRFASPLPMPKSTGVVDGGLGPERPVELVILLDLGFL